MSSTGAQIPWIPLPSAGGIGIAVDLAWPNGSSPFIGTISRIDVITTDRQRRSRCHHQWDIILKSSWTRDKQDDRQTEFIHLYILPMSWTDISLSLL